MKPSPSVVAVLSAVLALAFGYWYGGVSMHQQDQRTFANFIHDRVNADVDKMCAGIYQATLDEEEADVRLKFAISGNRPRNLPLLQQDFPLCLFDQAFHSSSLGTLVPTVRYPLSLDEVK